MEKFRKSSAIRLIAMLILLLSGAVVLYYTNGLLRQTSQEKRELMLIDQQDRVINQFESSISNFATLVSGMKSYIDSSPEVPAVSDLQKFVKGQIYYGDYNKDLVVSFIDTAHVFQFVFTQNSLDPGNLKGTSVRDIRNEDEIKKLDHLMKSDDLHIYEPINLKEGWLGIPLDFRVVKNNKVIGYMASILNLEIVLDDIYNNFNTKEFILQFKTPSGKYFDRTRIYDGSQVYHDSKDPENYTNFGKTEEDFRYEEVDLYGQKISIGIAYKNIANDVNGQSIFLFSWYLTLVIFALVSMLQWLYVQKINNKLSENESLLIQRNDELEKVNIELDRFVYGVTHDLKAPLANMSGLISLTKVEKDKERLLDYPPMMEETVEKMKGFIDELIIYARNANAEVQKHSIELKVLLTEVVDEHKYTSGAENINFEIHIAPDHKIISDPSRVRIIFNNLVSNAIKYHDYSKEKLFVKIEASEEEGKTVIVINDNGTGMPKEQTSKIFNMFYRVHDNNKVSGSGIGLYILKQALNKIEGDISVESTLGQGTTFTITIPNQ